jgi:hypothetical protein
MLVTVKNVSNTFTYFMTARHTNYRLSELTHTDTIEFGSVQSCGQSLPLYRANSIGYNVGDH